MTLGHGLYKIDHSDTKPEYLPAKAITMDSDWFDYDRWRKEGGYGRDRKMKEPDFSTPRAHLASHIDLATWYLQGLNAVNFPKIDQKLVETCTQEDFIHKYLAGDLTPGTRTLWTRCIHLRIR
jgi:hypothetical protein